MKRKLKKKLNVYTQERIKEAAYQFAYDRSNDWAVDNPTWQDVQDAFITGVNRTLKGKLF